MREVNVSLSKCKVNRGINKCLGVAFAVVTAVSMLAMSAFAETGVYDTVTESMTTSLTDLVSKAAIAIAAIVGVGITIFGIKWLVGVLKGFFSKLAK